MLFFLMITMDFFWFFVKYVRRFIMEMHKWNSARENSKKSENT